MVPRRSRLGAARAWVPRGRPTNWEEGGRQSGHALTPVGAHWACSHAHGPLPRSPRHGVAHAHAHSHALRLGSGRKSPVDVYPVTYGPCAWDLRVPFSRTLPRPGSYAGSTSGHWSSGGPFPSPPTGITQPRGQLSGPPHPLPDQGPVRSPSCERRVGRWVCKDRCAPGKEAPSGVRVHVCACRCAFASALVLPGAREHDLTSTCDRCVRTLTPVCACLHV